MGLLDWIDPTRQWPIVEGPAPDVSGVLMQLEAPRFGDPLESARALGRPDQFKWISRSRKECELLYARKGLRLRFREGKLSVVTLLIGRESCDHASFAPATPRAPDGTTLTPEIGKDRIVALFGEPDPGGSDDSCLQVFFGNGVIADFYFENEGHTGLTEWSLYPDD